MTDSHGKTKANSTVALNQPRRSSTSTINATIMIKDDTDNVSDSDAQSVINASKIDITAKNSLKSPWKDEMALQNDLSSEEDSNILPRATPIVGSKKSVKKKSMTPSHIVRKISSMRKNSPMMERSIQRSNQSSLHKLSSKKKSSKYHWSGTFRTRKNLFHKNMRDNTVFLLHDDVSEENDQLTAYNYNCENFAKKKFTDNGDIYYPNEFDSQTSDDSENKWIGCQPCIDICTNEYDGSDNFKDYVIQEDDGALPGATFDVNINFRRMTDIDNKDNSTCNIDSRANEQNNSTVLHSPFAHSTTILSPKIESNGTKVIRDIERKSNVRSRRFEAWCLLLSFLKNVFLFLLLPAIYITFFIYVQRAGN
ncbi:uncharacterized protein LOC113561451 [Ooceraea biroi]|uniref:uncharacterized protein LOC113561451 n=1 Tax=Ooceraea biroi TaxID=2015173 RepID=UPI000F07D647|nr:uncharacterized protein LOC113561451 [Ooceraea biroi]